MPDSVPVPEVSLAPSVGGGRPVLRTSRVLGAFTRTERVSYRVIYADTDQMGIVYHGAYVPLLERGRNEYIRASGYPYGKIEALGFVLPVIDMNIRYRQSARFDEQLIVETCMCEVTRLKVKFEYRVFRVEADGSESLLATGSTLHASIDKAGRPKRIPASFIDAMVALEPGAANTNSSSSLS